MLTRWRAAGLIWPTVMTLVMLPVLISLGTWQWHRKEWKEGLIAKLEARTKAEPVSYASALSAYVATGDVEYLRVRVTGTFDHSQERHLYAPRPEAQGWNVFTLLRPESGLPPVFINRGWVPERLKEPAAREAGQVKGPVTVVGLARLPESGGWFIPAPDRKNNRWYGRDLDAMRWGAIEPPSEEEQLMAVQTHAFAPFSIDAEAEPANPGGWPQGGTTEINLPNRHLEYVFTWYGLALALAVIFVMHARQRLADAGRADQKAEPIQPHGSA